MALKIVNDHAEIEAIGELTSHSVFDMDDVRRLSLYATVRANDIEDLKCFGDSILKESNKKEKTRISLQSLFIQPKNLQYTESDTLYGKESDSVRADSIESDVLVKDQHGIEYKVNGIRHYEFPVIGFYLDDRICPGFKYNVRSLDNDEMVFEGEPRVLQFIGMGYGKRLTFKGDQLNLNDCYFWTDSNPAGYGFSIAVINKGDNFMVYDSLNQRIGDVIIENIEGSQIEESMTYCKGDIVKMVRVRFTCSIVYHNRMDHDHLYDITNQDLQVVDGLVEVRKTRKSKESRVVCIRDVSLVKGGTCTLWNERI